MSNKMIIHEREISTLQEHPSLARLVIPSGKLAVVAQNMQEGLWDPLEILSDGTIVFGHQFFRAGRRLTWPRIEVVVLKDMTGGELHSHVLEATYLRRKVARGPGTYVLVQSSLGHPVPLSIGARRSQGRVEIRPGYYLYVGSALGGLPGSVYHHLNPEAKVQLNIDHLKPVMQPEALWFTYGAHKRDCDWADIIKSLAGSSTPCKEFGSSPCKCNTHLFYFEEEPSFSDFVDHVHAAIPEHASVHQLLRADLGLIAPKAPAPYRSAQMHPALMSMRESLNRRR